MPAYVVLGHYTEQRIRNIKNLAELRQRAEQWVASKGGRIIANYITFGRYNFVLIVELPSPEVALEGAFTFGAAGEVRTETMLGFSPEEAEAVAQRLP